MKITKNAQATIPEKKINWTEILIFYAVAVLISAPFRLNLIKLEEILPLPYGLNVFYRIFRGIGPAIGFLVIYFVFKSKVERRLTFWGTNKYYSLLAIILIPLGLTFSGVDNNSELNRHYFGFLTGITLIFYALGEEYGWRGYLQQALSPMNAPYRILTIAAFWYVWHLNFLLPDFSIRTHVVFFLFLLLGSWGLLKISESTFSILFVAAVHLSFNILSDVHSDFTKKVIVILVAIAVWIFLIVSLNKQKTKDLK
jgi:membrane protease YdiL (CAAX protease family)